MMISLLFAIIVTGCIVLAGEELSRRQVLKGEYARKFVHIFAGVFAALWPLFLTRPQIILLAVLFAVVVVAVKRLNVLRSFKAVRRVTYGEIWYAVGIVASAVVFEDGRMYALAVLHMALADGMAAVIGVWLGKRGRIFRFRGSRKSVIGSLTFAVISFGLNIGFWLTLPTGTLAMTDVSTILPILLSASAAIILTCAEIMAPKGSDNVLIPLLAGALVWLPLALA